MDSLALAHEIRDWMIALGTIGAVLVALWLATRDRREALARESRERGVQTAQRRLDDAMAILEAWEDVWAYTPRPWEDDGGDPHGWHDRPAFRLAVARLSSLVRASGEPYVFARGHLFNHLGPDAEYSQTFFDHDHDLGEAGKYQVHDPESEDIDRWIIRTEVLEAAEKARKAMTLAGQATRTPKE